MMEHVSNVVPSGWIIILIMFSLLFKLFIFVFCTFTLLHESLYKIHNTTGTDIKCPGTFYNTISDEP